MKKIHIDQIKLGAIVSYLALFISIITGIIYTPWMVSKIGQSNYGLYTLATSLISIFMLDFGLGSAVSRFVSKYRAEGNVDGVNKIIGLIYKLYIAIDIVVAAVLVIVFFFLENIYVKFTPQEMEQFRTLYIMVAGFNVISFPFSPLNGILNAYEKFFPLKLCDLISKLFTVALVVVALSFSSSVVLVVAANIISNLICIIIKLSVVKTSIPIKTDFRAKGRELYKTLFSFTVWTTVISIMQRFTHSFAPSVLGITASSLEIAIYAPAVVLEGYYYTLAIAVNGLFLPRVSKYIANKEEDKILPLMIKVGRYQLLVLGLVFAGFVCLGDSFMVLWMGPEYAKTYYCAILILLPTFISATQQIANTTVIAKKLIKYQALCMIFTGVIGLVISYVMSIFVGAIGVCIGTAVTALCNICFNNYIYRYKAGINTPVFYKKCYLRAIPCYAVVIALGFLITHLIKISGWTGLVIEGFLFVVIYALVFLFEYFPKDERTGLLRSIKNRF